MTDINELAESILYNKDGLYMAYEDPDGELRVWLYTPGYGGVKWDEFYEKGIMGIARDYLGDLSQYESREAMRKRMNECSTDKGTSTNKNASLEAWQFVHDIKPGDFIFAKKGKRTLLGAGTVCSDYIYDETQPDEYKNIRKVKWEYCGEWETAFDLETKILTDITPYSKLVAMLFLYIDPTLLDIEEETKEKPAVHSDLEYTREQFLSEVYMSEEKYEAILYLLHKKKNMILQGAPGVGKTFAATRLAYSVIGSKNSDQVMTVQFHQSYSYEDFIMGFYPNQEGGFTLRQGPFYKFCTNAEANPDKEYFFIIDEINRGNLGKIFGELFMLIEKDKRGQRLPLLHSDELFAVPENVYIIGTMNTADRSLAMLDYALRRRFAFFDLEPAFDSDGFCKYLQSINNARLNKLISTVKRLNEAIKKDDTLGAGFCIGHSYFCALPDEQVNGSWLNAVVDYELVQLLREYWFDDPEKVSIWEQALHEAIR